MKAVMISIRPEWCEKIANGRKTLEIRKTKPKLETPFKCYIYCTKAKNVRNKLYRLAEDGIVFKLQRGDSKVIGEFICDSVLSHCEMANADLAERLGCIRREKIREYAGEKEAFGWHISELKIYDEPKELSEFLVEGSQTFDYPPLTKMKRPPQSWCYVEENTDE